MNSVAQRGATCKRFFIARPRPVIFQHHIMLDVGFRERQAQVLRVGVWTQHPLNPPQASKPLQSGMEGSGLLHRRPVKLL